MYNIGQNEVGTNCVMKIGGLRAFSQRECFLLMARGDFLGFSAHFFSFPAIVETFLMIGIYFVAFIILACLVTIIFYLSLW